MRDSDTRVVCTNSNSLQVTWRNLSALRSACDGTDIRTGLFNDDADVQKLDTLCSQFTDTAVDGLWLKQRANIKFSK